DINREHFSGLEQRVQESHAHMLSAQADLLSSPSISAAAREREAHRNWTKLAKAEEKFIYQRSRMTWAKFGDCNSSLFHRSMQARRSGNQIHYLIDDQNLRLENINDIKSHCVEYYTSLLEQLCWRLIHLPMKTVQILIAGDHLVTEPMSSLSPKHGNLSDSHINFQIKIHISKMWQY
ncbi:hypothetical protein HID58_056199, partial [Brassica napus]